MAESLEEFQTVLSGLTEDQEDQNMDKFREEYEKLLNVLTKSYGNEKRLMTKCKELSAEIASASTKFDAAVKMTQDDETTISSLKTEVEKAWKMVDAAYVKEQAQMEMIKNLQEEVTGLTQLAEQQSMASANQDQSDLLKMIEDLTNERDRLLTTVESLREQLSIASTSKQKAENQREAALNNISQLQHEIQLQQNDISREQRLKEKLEKELNELSINMETKIREILTLKKDAQTFKEEQLRSMQQLKSMKNAIEKVTKELEQLQHKTNKLQRDRDQLVSVRERIFLENQKNLTELKLKEDVINQIRQEISKERLMKEAIQKKFRVMEDQKSDVEVQREILKARIAGVEKEFEGSRKQVEADKKVINELTRERDLLSKNVAKATEEIEETQISVMELENDKRVLQQEISGNLLEGQKQRKIIQDLEKERDRYINEANNLLKKVQEKADEIETSEMAIHNWKKRVAEEECKLKRKEDILESVISERNHYSKNLVEAQDSISKLKIKMRSMANQMTQLKDEITAKELVIYKDQQHHKRLERDNEVLKADLKLIKQQLEEEMQRVENLKVEKEKLEKIIDDNQVEQTLTKKQLEQVIRERDNLGKQLLQRNEERTLLYEKIKIQISIISKRDFHHNQRMEDIRLLKLEIKRLRREKNILDKTVPNTDELRREMFTLQRELAKERIRNGVLEEQLNPINIHRWRRLEGSDPCKYELIQKVHTLQRRLINKTEEFEEVEFLLQEKEKLYVELQQLLARQPGPETLEQLQHCQWTLRERTKKLMALTAEVRVLDAKMIDYKSENQSLNTEITELKKKYFSQKKQQSEKAKSKAEHLVLPQLINKPQFTGGGFKFDELFR
ncbi:cilia- and flagella-associated protein 58 [Nerophis lumbriciformis]|uniref:cilia- and flagella-associated protein 58 n=1 Tax=Nerophis lumbriciformis TaxID=546530 RepID=UPI002ADF9E68|nr:cilia- and flagella-associated protein 58-like [Nerophis lumbriciformis]XP_061817828.1 cilia- and flagella-associated protein 58-like [Nerophis lumbriciformis]XP_061819203.1 cilia- and flagella-associated protein 58-like [Nerophis lumbriciformis]XP_061819204.1 cilia- and flagella-associated protein 58-like [Nerophis lumbriciformis]